MKVIKISALKQGTTSVYSTAVLATEIIQVKIVNRSCAYESKQHRAIHTRFCTKENATC
jgi:hypothetical protein